MGLYFWSYVFIRYSGAEWFWRWVCRFLLRRTERNFLPLVICHSRHGGDVWYLCFLNISYVLLSDVWLCYCDFRVWQTSLKRRIPSKAVQRHFLMMHSCPRSFLFLYPMIESMWCRSFCSLDLYDYLVYSFIWFRQELINYKRVVLHSSIVHWYKLLFLVSFFCPHV